VVERNYLPQCYPIHSVCFCPLSPFNSAHSLSLSFSAITESIWRLGIVLNPQNNACRTITPSLPPQLAIGTDVVHDLWCDPGIKDAVRRSRIFQTDDFTVYYFNAFDQMAVPNYMPTDRNILGS
jgi:guanine nucleotide-binding protein G(i) subunit alpha